MKKILGMFMVFCVMCMYSTAMAQDKYGVYVTPKFMFDATQADYLKVNHTGENGVKRLNTSVGGAIALGYDFDVQYNVPVRVEVEYAMRTDANYRFDHRNIVARLPQSVFANAYLDFKNSTDFTPYVGGGLGIGIIGTNSNFAWNAGAGVAYELMDGVDLDLGYRYVSLGQFENRHTKADYNAHEVMLGVRLTF